jgi:hypothetical protein
MDGILEELLRLENGKNQALISCDAAAYDNCVREQSRLINHPDIPSKARSSADKLLAFSRLANLNASLYFNLIATMTASPAQSYAGDGRMADTAASRRVLAEG